MSQGFVNDSLLEIRDTAFGTKTGAIAVATGAIRMAAEFDGTVIGCRAMLNTAPTGSSAIFDVHKNGTTIFTTQANRPTVAISAFDSGVAVPDVTAFAIGDYFTIDIDQKGSTIAGSDLALTIQLKRDISLSELRQVLFMSDAGVQTVASGTIRFPLDYNGQILGVRAMVNTAPTGATLIVDVHLNGTTVFTTQANRPTIAASGTDSGVAIPDVVSFVTGDYLQFDVDQIGSSVAGSDLSISTQLRRI